MNNKIIENNKFIIIKKDDSSSWITLVHGFTHDYQYFMNQVEDLKSRYNILLINLLGHGSRSEDEGPFNLYSYSLDIANILNELGINKTIYWGTHTGAACGLLLACKAPSYIKGLILEGTPVPGAKIPSINRYFTATQNVYNKDGLKKSLDYWFHKSGWFQHMHKNSSREIIDNQFKMLSRYKGKHFDYQVVNTDYNLIPKISKVKIPTLLYNGQYDLDDFLKASYEISRTNSNFHIKQIANTGGFPSWEDNKAVAKVVIPFITTKIEKSGGY